MSKIRLSQLFIFISALSFLAILVMIVQKSYNNLINTSQQIVPPALLQPIDTKLDTQIFTDIEALPEYPVSSLNISTESAFNP